MYTRGILMEFKETQAILDDVARLGLQPGESKQVHRQIVSRDYAHALVKELNDHSGLDVWFSWNDSYDGAIIEVQRLGDS